MAFFSRIGQTVQLYKVSIEIISLTIAKPQDVTGEMI